MNGKLWVWVISGILLVFATFSAANAGNDTGHRCHGPQVWFLLSPGTIAPGQLVYIPLSPYLYGGPAPVRIQNPFVLQTATSLPILDPRLPIPLRIVNPYVAKPGDPNVSAAAVMPRRPQVVHPAAMDGPPLRSQGADM